MSHFVCSTPDACLCSGTDEDCDCIPKLRGTRVGKCLTCRATLRNVCIGCGVLLEEVYPWDEQLAEEICCPTCKKEVA